MSGFSSKEALEEVSCLKYAELLFGRKTCLGHGRWGARKTEKIDLQISKKTREIVVAKKISWAMQRFSWKHEA